MKWHKLCSAWLVCDAGYTSPDVESRAISCVHPSGSLRPAAREANAICLAIACRETAMLFPDYLCPVVVVFLKTNRQRIRCIGNGRQCPYTGKRSGGGSRPPDTWQAINRNPLKGRICRTQPGGYKALKKLQTSAGKQIRISVSRLPDHGHAQCICQPAPAMSRRSEQWHRLDGHQARLQSDLLNGEDAEMRKMQKE